MVVKRRDWVDGRRLQSGSIRLMVLDEGCCRCEWERYRDRDSASARAHSSLADARCCIFWSFMGRRAWKRLLGKPSLTRFVQARQTPYPPTHPAGRKPPRSVERATVNNNICKEDATNPHRLTASGRSLRFVRARVVLLLSARHSGLSVRMATPAADTMHPCLPLPRASAGRRLQHCLARPRAETVILERARRGMHISFKIRIPHCCQHDSGDLTETPRLRA